MRGSGDEEIGRRGDREMGRRKSEIHPITLAPHLLTVIII
jgi:hypothetical protein